MLQRSLISLIASVGNKRSLLSCAKVSMRCISAGGCRSFSSAENASMKSTKTAASSKPASSKLLRVLNSEIEAQKEVSQEQVEEFDPKTVVEEFSEFLTKGSWTLEHDQQNSTQVVLKRRDNSLQGEIALKFDLVQVFNEIYDMADGMENYEDDGTFSGLEEEPNYGVQEEETTKDEDNNNNNSIKNEEALNEEIDEDFEFDALPFTIEVKRDSIPGKTLHFTCVSEGTSSESEIVLESVSINSNATSSAYTAPNFKNLDEPLQGAFEDYVKKLVGSPEQEKDLHAFIKSYTIAAESRLYEGWLDEVKTMINPSKNN